MIVRLINSAPPKCKLLPDQIKCYDSLAIEWSPRHDHYPGTTTAAAAAAQLFWRRNSSNELNKLLSSDFNRWIAMCWLLVLLRSYTALVYYENMCIKLFFSLNEVAVLTLSKCMMAEAYLYGRKLHDPSPLPSLRKSKYNVYILFLNMLFPTH